MQIKKMGNVIEFSCGSCGGIFYAGVNETDNSNGNYYCKCPMCGSECHTDVAKQSNKKHENSQSEKMYNK